MASAAAEGSSTPPARDTGREVVGSLVGTAEAAAVTATEDIRTFDDEASAALEANGATELAIAGSAEALEAPKLNVWLESDPSQGA